MCLRQTGGQTDRQTDRQTESEEDAAAAAALVTPHLDHPFVRGALQVGISALCPAVTACVGSPEQTHVGAYPTDQPPLPPADRRAG